MLSFLIQFVYITFLTIPSKKIFFNNNFIQFFSSSSYNLWYFYIPFSSHLTFPLSIFPISQITQDEYTSNATIIPNNCFKTSVISKMFLKKYYLIVWNRECIILFTLRLKLNFFFNKIWRWIMILNSKHDI